MIDDETGLRECLHNAVALFGGRCTDPSQLVWLEQSRAALSAVAPPPVLERVDAVVDRLKDRVFPNHECPAESAAVWNVALYEMRDALTATPAAPAQPDTHTHIWKDTGVCRMCGTWEGSPDSIKPCPNVAQPTELAGDSHE